MSLVPVVPGKRRLQVLVNRVAYGYENGIKTRFLKILQCIINTPFLAGFHGNTELQKGIYLIIKDRLGNLEFGETIAQHATQFLSSLINRYVVSLPGQEIGCCQA